MTTPPPVLRDQRKIDAQHLKLLTIFHFVKAALSLLGILFLVAHFFFFRMFMTNPRMFGPGPGAMPAELFVILKVFYLFAAMWLIFAAVLNVTSGIFISAKKHRTFSLVVAGLNCLSIPLGTALGICTIIVLIRESVVAEYEAKDRS
jgi:hypothetical protein